MREIHFKLLAIAYCDKCDKVKMHQWGTQIGRGTKIKVCLKCYKTSEVQNFPNERG